MKLLSILFFCLGLAALAQQQSALTNDSVVKLVKAQLSDEVIVNTIKSQLCLFQLGTDDLIALRQAGVSDKVIAAMVDKANIGVAAGLQSASGPCRSCRRYPAAACPTRDITFHTEGFHRQDAQ